MDAKQELYQRALMELPAFDGAFWERILSCMSTHQCADILKGIKKSEISFQEATENLKQKMAAILQNDTNAWKDIIGEEKKKILALKKEPRKK